MPGKSDCQVKPGYLSRFEPAISNLYDIPGYKGTFFKESTDVFVITSKGQIISECPYEIIVYPKIATKKFPRFLC